MYLRYLMYVLKHKWYVFKYCISKGMIIHAFTHDLSKFRPSEFIPYAKHFYGNEHNERPFRVAVLHHYNRNKHHFAYWMGRDDRVYDMPKKYVKQMVADWLAMSYAKKKKEYDHIDMYSNEVVEDVIKFYFDLDHSKLSTITCFNIEECLKNMEIKLN